MPPADLAHLWVELSLVPEALALVPAHVKVHYGPPAPASPLASLAPAQAIVASPILQYTDAVFAVAPGLRIVSRAGIGVDNVDIAAATRRGIVVCNAPDGPTESTAEHAVALMLALAKRLKPADANMAAGKFGPRGGLMGVELKGRTLGLVGLGRIGRRVADICGAGLKMRVIAHDPAVTTEQAAALGAELKPLDAVIAEADVLSLHAPLLPSTRHLINRERLARMKKGAILVNVARGGLVVEADLLAAVSDGSLAGAGLDAFDPEPPAADSPLRRHPDILVSPHSATATAEGRARTDIMAVEAVLAFFRGERPANVVNPESVTEDPRA